MVEGDTESCPGVGAEVEPVPLRVCAAGESEALLTKDTVPGALPAARGAKVTVYWALLPALTVNGNVMPLTVYPSPVLAAEDTVTSAPLADKVPVLTVLFPIATLPKVIVDGDTESCPEPDGGGGEEADEIPAQPDSRSKLATARRPPARRNRNVHTLATGNDYGPRGKAGSREPKDMTAFTASIALL